MKSKRIENDLRIAWTITTNGKADSLEGRALTLSMRSALGWQQVTDFAVSGNTVTFIFRGSEQKVTGVYLLKLQETTGGVMRTIDVCRAFQLVPHSYQENDPNISDLDDPNVELKSDVQVGMPGLSAYEIWLKRGHTGTEADFIAWCKGEKGAPFRYEDFTPEQIADIKRPALDAADIVRRRMTSLEVSEEQRLYNERIRVDSENRRLEDEASRRADENKRRDNEVARVKAEDLRIEEENDRKAMFNIIDQNAKHLTEMCYNAADKAIEAAKNVKDGYLGIAYHGTKFTTFAIEPNVMNVWGDVSSLTLTLAPNPRPGVLAEYAFEFSSPAGMATTLSLPANIKWYNDYVIPIEPGKTYQASIVHNIIIMGGVTI